MGETSTYAVNSVERSEIDELWAKALRAKNPVEAILHLTEMRTMIRRIERRLDPSR